MSYFPCRLHRKMSCWKDWPTCFGIIVILSKPRSIINGWSNEKGRRCLSSALGDKQETSLEKQLTWALGAAKDQGVSLNVTLEDLQYMQAYRLHQHKAVYLDDALSGDDLERPGLKSLVEDFHHRNDHSHLFVFKRDRLGRPDSPLDMMVIEDGLRRAGITIVRSDGVSQPATEGDANLGEMVMMLFDYQCRPVPAGSV